MFTKAAIELNDLQGVLRTQMQAVKAMKLLGGVSAAAETKNTKNTTNTKNTKNTTNTTRTLHRDRKFTGVKAWQKAQEAKLLKEFKK